MLIWIDLPSVSVSWRGVTSVILPFDTVIWTWTAPNLVWTAVPVYVPEADEFELPEEPVAADPVPVEPRPDELVPDEPVPVDPVVPAAVVLDATVLMPPTWVPACQPARRIPAEARAAATAPRTFTSQTFRDGSVPRERRPYRHP